jgi:GTPase
MSAEATSTFHCGFVALVGRPNVGKSTLVNALLGTKVAIVTPKPQTTRTQLHAIINRPDAQLILVDTPGLVSSDSALRRSMRRITGTAAAGADGVLVVAECRGEDAVLSDFDRDVLAEARKGRGKVVLAINKVDLLPRKDRLLPWIDTYCREQELAAVVPVSAREGEGLDLLMRELWAILPEGPALFPADMHTDQAERFLCAELTREQLMLKLREEVPYGVAVVIESFEDERDEKGGGLCRIEGRIYVERESQKAIVIGAGGQMIKSVSQAARLEIEQLLDCKVYLRLTVHVARNWTEDDNMVRRFGYGPQGGGDLW